MGTIQTGMCDPKVQFLGDITAKGWAAMKYDQFGPLSGLGVGEVVESGHPEFKEGDLVWGTTKWEHYSLITQPQSLHKIQHTDVPLSYIPVYLDEPKKDDENEERGKR